MSERNQVRAAIVDYGLGSLFSVKHACEHADMHAVITSSKDEILHLIKQMNEIFLLFIR